MSVPGGVGYADAMEKHLSPFLPWGSSHIAIIAGSFLLPAGLSLARRAFCGPGYDGFVRRGLAAAVLLSWLGWYVAGFRHGWLDTGNALPLNLCDWAAACVSIALICRAQWAYDLAYFWALGGTVQALISPDVPYDFPEVRIVLFTLFHGGIIAGVLYLTLSGQMRPWLSSLKRIFWGCAVYAVCAGAADALLGVNYGFLRAKPGVVSLLSGMPPWPWYLPLLAMCACIAVLICYAPFCIRDLRRASEKEERNQA